MVRFEHWSLSSNAQRLQVSGNDCHYIGHQLVEIVDCPQHAAGQAIKPANGYIGDQAGSQRGRYIDAVSEHRFDLRQKVSPVGELSTASVGCQLYRTALKS